MAYRVKLTPRAQKDVEELHRWAIVRAPHQGAAWYNGLIDAIFCTFGEERANRGSPRRTATDAMVTQRALGAGRPKS
jgi:hypothetical protein